MARKSSVVLLDHFIIAGDELHNDLQQVCSWFWEGSAPHAAAVIICGSSKRPLLQTCRASLPIHVRGRNSSELTQALVDAAIEIIDLAHGDPDLEEGGDLEPNGDELDDSEGGV